MGRAIGWIIVFVVVGLFEMPRMWRKHEIYDMWVFGVLLFATTVYGLLYMFEAPLPDPQGLIKLIFGPIGSRIMGHR